ncbi:hypothetical protein BD769DRAFT_1670916 [Suillus cothurnatus]|nr:hypothetical protein BD769DRAFT_1670916 [Suillus cothurnatus]
MSDEVSGPEEEDKPDIYDDWKRQMATLAGFCPETPTSHLKLLEVIHLQWRSAAQERQGTREVLDPSERFWLVLRRCQHSKVSPYDFGINFDWLDDMSKQHLLKERLRDWGKYGNPTGFEAKGDRHAAGKGSEVEGDGDAACEGPEAEGDVNVGAEADDGMSDGDMQAIEMELLMTRRCKVLRAAMVIKQA